jgi:hypothetical protein
MSSEASTIGSRSLSPASRRTKARLQTRKIEAMENRAKWRKEEEYHKSKMEQIEDYYKKIYMRDNYSMAYSICLERPKELYFDERFWTSKDISVFFDDLCYCDNHAYELSTYKLYKSRGIKSFTSAKKRVDKWIKTNNISFPE